VTFKEVLGHSRILERLRRCLASGRVAHAYLFVGPRGVGKSTVARAFAAALTCRAEPLEGCGACPSCKRIASGGHPDVHLVEPEGPAVKIEHVRDLQEALAYRPAEAPRSVAVVPNAERLTIQAANALLKTLEEPPRCERVAFAPLPTEELARILVEKRGMKEEVASLVAAMVAGRPGLALGADLGELKALRDRAWGLLKAAAEGPASILEWSQGWFDEARQGRLSLKASAMELNSALLSLTRDAVVCSSRQTGRLVHADMAERYEALVLARKTEAAISAFEAVQVAQSQLMRNLNPQLICETMGLAITEASRGSS
jgi:DNA polymerase-3 subunit delta'